MFLRRRGLILENLEFCHSFTKRVASAINSCRIRRTNDDAETDILLETDGTDIDINSLVSAGGTLATWIGSNDGRMVTDYDQTGNGHDFTQSTKANQASIVLAGVWNGYKFYDGTDDYYKTATQVTNQVGSVYVKVGWIASPTRYFLSQAFPSGTNDDKVLSFATSFGTGNKARILDFSPTAKTIEGTTVLVNTSQIITYRAGATNKHTIRVDGSNESLTATSPETDNWFGDYTDTGFTLQKGRLLWNGGSNAGETYREYEMMVFSVEHDDIESAEIEALM